MAPRHTSSTNTTFAFGIIFLLIALCLTAVSFSTNNWLETYVDRDQVSAQVFDPDVLDTFAFYSRYRGLFFTCFPDNAKFLDNPLVKPHVKEGRCLTEGGYELPTRRPSTIGYSDSYQIRIHLLRSHFAAMVLAMLFFVVCIILGVTGCWRSNASMMRSSGILVFVGMFFAGAGMALFHGYNYLEVNVLKEVPDTPAWVDNLALSDLNYNYLTSNSTTQFGFSYILGWLGLAMSILAAVMFLITAYKLAEAEEAELYGSKKGGYRNRAYDHMDRSRILYPGPDDYYKSQPRSQLSAYPAPQPGYLDRSPYDFSGGYRY